jgi:thioredoxin reductase
MDDARVVVIGAGPAGLAAAMQLQRQGQQPVVLEAEQPGGLLLNANLVENYPGFPGGISGPELVRLFVDQARKLHVEITAARVIDLSLKEDRFIIQTDQGSLSAVFVVLATGTEPKLLTEVHIDPSAQRDLYYHVVPLLERREQRILIIGAGDAALDYALNLSRHNRVVIFNRGTRVKGLGLLWERIQRVPDIKYRDRHQVREVQRGSGGKLQVLADHGGGQVTLEVDAVLAAVGRQPALGYLDPALRDRLPVYRQEGRLYLIGDLRNQLYRQTAIAVGDGVKAAMEIEGLRQEEQA